jgi:hypothetical protein
MIPTLNRTDSGPKATIDTGGMVVQMDDLATRAYWWEGLEPQVARTSGGTSLAGAPDIIVIDGIRFFVGEMKVRSPRTPSEWDYWTLAPGEEAYSRMALEAASMFAKRSPAGRTFRVPTRPQTVGTLQFVSSDAPPLLARPASLDSSVDAPEWVSPFEEALKSYSVANRRDVETFLRAHLELLPALRDAPQYLDAAFGVGAKYVLEVYRDPEGGAPELVVRVRSQLAWQPARAAMDTFENEWWLDTNAVTSGHLSFLLR